MASIKCWGGGREINHKTYRKASKKNPEQAKKFSKLVPAGQDNRADMLHEARFFYPDLPVNKQTYGLQRAAILTLLVWNQFPNLIPKD